MRRVISLGLALVLLLGILPAAGLAVQVPEEDSCRKVPEKAPTCLEDGCREYYQDAEGNVFVKEEEGLVPVRPSELRIPALGHDWGAVQCIWSEDCSSCRAERTCRRDPGHRESAQATVTSQVLIPPTGTEMGTTRYTASFQEAWARTELHVTDRKDIPVSSGPDPTDPPETSGPVEPEETTTPIEPPETSAPVEPPHVHSLREVREQKPDCVRTGVRAHWHCTGCGRNFLDPGGTQELETVTLPALGHDWSAAEYTWARDGSSCQARRTCRRDPGHRETAIAAIRREITGRPTQEDPVTTTTYTAIFEEAWAQGNKPQTLVLTDAPVHVHQMLHQPGKKPTCLEEGVEEYWQCQICQRRYTDPQGKNEIFQIRIPQLDHDWEIDYVWEGRTCRAFRTCRRGCGAEEEAEAEITVFETLLPTCTEGGKRAILAQFSEGWPDTQLREEPISALGHSWEKPTYVWTADGSACTAERVCSRDDGHVETARGQISDEPGKKPGQLVRTARFDQDWALPATFEGGAPAAVRETVPETVETTAPELQMENGDFLVARQPTVITRAQLDAFRDAAPSGDRSLNVDCGPCRVTYNALAIQSLLRKTRGCQRLELLAETRNLRDPALTEAQYSTLSRNWKEGSLYHTGLTLYRDGTVQNLEEVGGEAALTIPMHVAVGRQVRAWNLDPEGGLHEVPARADYIRDTVTVSTTVHGYYLVRTRMSPVMAAILAVLLVGAVVATVLLLRRKFYSMH